MKSLPFSNAFLLGIALLSLTRVRLDAQQPTFDWATKLTTGRDYPRSGVAADPEGNVIVTYPFGTSFTNVLTKLNPQGGVTWSQRLPVGVQGGIATDIEGNLYLAGSALNYIPGQPTPF